MSDFEFPFEQFSPVTKRLLHWLGMAQERELLVLRAQMLLEEQLKEALNNGFRAPQYLQLKKMPYSRVLTLFQAFYGIEDSNPRIQFMRGLNSLRNDIAHQIDVEELDLRIGKLTALIDPEVDNPIAPGHEVPYLFTLAIAEIVGYLIACWAGPAE